MSKGKPLGHCTTCGSEIVETVNDSLFREGECDACEYERYKTHPDLLAACKSCLEEAKAALAGEWEPTADGWQATIRSLERVIAKAEGRA